MRHNQNNNPHSSEAGFALGAILFVIAMLGLIALLISAGGGGFSNAGVADRTSATIEQQANLMRSVINQCNIQYLAARSLCNTVGACPSCTLATGSNCSVDITNTDPYPQSASGGTPVASLLCDPVNSLSLWGQTLVPQPTAEFNTWTYVDAGDGGGRCIWTQPKASGSNTNTGIVSGLTKAANHFSNGTSFNSSNEVIYDPSSSSQKFTMWITVPTITPDSHCLP